MPKDSEILRIDLYRGGNKKKLGLETNQAFFDENNM